MNNIDGYDIIKKYGLPREMCSCPMCGQVYGHHRTKVCQSCECCTKCCECPKDERKLMNPSEFVFSHT